MDTSSKLILLLYIFGFLTKLELVESRVDRVHPNENQKDILHQTFKNLMKIQEQDDYEEEESFEEKRPVSKSSRAASKYMRRLFEIYTKHEPIDNRGLDLQEKKTIVRAITPKVGRFDDRDALIFDLHVLDSTESLIKAEIHYYSGTNRPSPDSKATTKKVHCYVLNQSSSESESNGKPIRSTDSELPLAEIDRGDRSIKNWAVFDLSDFLNTTRKQYNDTDSRRLAVIFSKSNGDRLRFSPARKTLRFHAPFLSISSFDQGRLSNIDPQIDADQEDEASDDRSDRDKSIEGDQHRRKRNVDTKYYEYYHPYDTAFTTSPNDVGFNWKSMSPELPTTTTSFVQRGPSVLRRNGAGQPTKARRGHRKGRRGAGRRYQDQYLGGDNEAGGGWSPAEQEETSGKGKNRKKKYGKVLKNKDDDQNPTVVVLLDEKSDEITCRRNDLVVDFHDIGWGDHVIAPSSFEAHYCAGSCPFPVPSTVNATNHAIVLDIIKKIRLHPQLPKPCCAPEKMDSLSLLYYDSNGNVVLTTYPKMSVVSCACL